MKRGWRPFHPFTPSPLHPFILSFRNPQSELSAAMRHSVSTPVVVAPSGSPFVAVPSVSESESPVVVPPVSESEPRPAPVPSAVAGVMPVDEFFRLLIVEAPAPLLCESLDGQRQIDHRRQSSNEQSESQRFQSEHRISFFEFVSPGDCLRRREWVPRRGQSFVMGKQIKPPRPSSPRASSRPGVRGE